MNNERSGGSYKGDEARKPDRKAEREKQLNRYKKIGLAAIAAASLAVGSYGANAMNKSTEKWFVEQSEEVDVDEMHIKDGANIRIMPIANDESIVVAKIQGEDGGVTLDCSGEPVRYYKNKSDPDGGWYGIPEDVLLENEIITSPIGHEVAWINESNVMGVVESDNLGDKSM